MPDPNSSPCFWPLGPPDAATLSLVSSGAYLSEILAKYYESKHGSFPALATVATATVTAPAAKATHLGLSSCPVPTIPSLANLKQKHLIGVFATIVVGSAVYHVARATDNTSTERSLGLTSLFDFITNTAVSTRKSLSTLFSSLKINNSSDSNADGNAGNR